MATSSAHSGHLPLEGKVFGKSLIREPVFPFRGRWLSEGEMEEVVPSTLSISQNNPLTLPVSVSTSTRR